MGAERFAWGQAFFCDDVRFEMGGKISLVGVYNSDMVFPSETTFPAAVAKLGIYVRYTEIRGAFKDDIELKIYLPGDETEKASINIPVSRKDLDAIPRVIPDADEPDPEIVYSIAYPLVLSPVQISSVGAIKVRAECGKNITRLGRLNIRLPTENEINYPTVQPNWPRPKI